MPEDQYLEFVCKEAQKTGKYFMLDSGEGREFVDLNTGWTVEDLSGWLVEPKDHDNFVVLRNIGRVGEEFASSYVFVLWIKEPNGDINIEFRHY